MYQTSFGPQDAAILAGKAEGLRLAAQEISAFQESSPQLAAQAGVEVCALEARTILAGGAVDRIVMAGTKAAESGRPLSMNGPDLDALTRLEGVVMVSEARIGSSLGTLEHAEAGGGMETLAGWVGLAGGVVGLVKTFF